ncbi:MAG TPA: thioredoxin family protein [Candidatus Paceibacterota bacterium]
MKPVVVEELSSPGCHVCKQFEEFWHSIEKDWPNVQYRNLNVVTPEGQEVAQKYMIMASPGIILNGELWSTGGFHKEKFVQKLKELSQAT